MHTRTPPTLLAAVALLAAACDDLPHENGVEWQCNVQAERGGLVVGSHPADGALWVCANPDVSPSDVRGACEDQCEDKWCTWGFTSSFPFITFCTDATCTVVGDNPSPSGIECDENSDPGGPAKASVALTGEAIVTVDGESGVAPVSGFLRYTIWDCGAVTCPITFAEIALDVAPFDIDGHDITAYVHNGINAEGTWSSDTSAFHFDPGVLLINTNFTVDGDAGATGLLNTGTAVEGVIDPDNDVFAFAPATFSQDDVTVTITSLTGLHTNRPPVAVIAPDSPIECNTTLAADVTLDGGGSVDVDGNIERYEWRIDGADVGTGETLPVQLPFGASDVELTVVDALTAFDKEEQTLEVQDTTAPSLDAPPDVEIECTSPLGATVDIGTATASDVCDDAIVVTNDAASAVFPLGTTLVTWSAEDFSGNTSEATQGVEVVDTTPPVMTLALSPTTLWPPNHKMRTITATLSVTDVCDAAPTITLVSITSNEPDNGLGDGDTTGDIAAAAFGTDDRSFQLRAERSGAGAGRTYTVTYRASDASGNTTDAVATVVVPH